MAGHWVYIDIPSKTSRYTLFCEVADRLRFKNRTVTALASAPQGQTVRSYVFHTTRDEHRLWNNLKKPRGPSAPKGQTVRRSSLKSTRDNNVSGTNCQIAGGPSAPQGQTVRRTDHKPNQRKHPLWYNLS